MKIISLLSWIYPIDANQECGFFSFIIIFLNNENINREHGKRKKEKYNDNSTYALSPLVVFLENIF